MGFAAVPPDEIARGVQVLARLLDGRPLTREAPPRSGKHVDSRSAAPRQE
jgi:hypothetical protein